MYFWQQVLLFCCVDHKSCGCFKNRKAYLSLGNKHGCLEPHVCFEYVTCCEEYDLNFVDLCDSVYMC